LQARPYGPRAYTGRPYAGLRTHSPDTSRVFSADMRADPMNQALIATLL